MTTLRCEAPSDAQLRYLHDLCEERGIVPPLVVGSKDDASAAIGAVLARQDLSRWTIDEAGYWEVPF